MKYIIITRYLVSVKNVDMIKKNCMYSFLVIKIYYKHIKFKLN